MQTDTGRRGEGRGGEGRGIEIFRMNYKMMLQYYINVAKYIARNIYRMERIFR